MAGQRRQRRSKRSTRKEQQERSTPQIGPTLPDALETQPPMEADEDLEELDVVEETTFEVPLPQPTQPAQRPARRRHGRKSSARAARKSRRAGSPSRRARGSVRAKSSKKRAAR